MNSNFKNKSMEEVFNSLLELLDKYEVSPEDGAVLSANLLFNSLSFLNETSGSMINSILQVEKALAENFGSEDAIISSTFRQTNKPYSIIGLDRIWGLDPALVDEEH